jgi:hypothetical protein
LRYNKWRTNAIAQNFSAKFFLYITCIFLRGERGKRDISRTNAIAQKFIGAESLRYGAEKFALRGETGQVLREQAGRSGINGVLTPSRKKKKRDKVSHQLGQKLGQSYIAPISS